MNFLVKHALFWMLTLTASFPCNLKAQENTQANGNQDGIPEVTLELTEHNLFPKQVTDFVQIKNTYPEFYSLIQKQLPSNAALLEVFVPQQYHRVLAREEYGEITRMVYLYTMPYLLSPRDNVRYYNFMFVRQAYETALRDYEKVDMPGIENLSAWTQEVRQKINSNTSIIFDSKRQHGDGYLYSMLQNYPSKGENSVNTMMSTFMFVRKQQVYFLSSYSFLLGDNYAQELDWTRDSLDTLIDQIVQSEN